MRVELAVIREEVRGKERNDISCTIIARYDFVR